MVASTVQQQRCARLRRARLRRREGGAVLFIVAVTLGLLAVMGVYGLTAASNDVRAAGDMRQALQGQRAGEAAMVMTAETFNPTVAATLVAQMSNNVGQTKTCKSAGLYTGAALTRDAEACLSLDPLHMKTISQFVNGGANQWTSISGAQDGFTLQSFGPVAQQPYITVELTNPIDVPNSKYSKTVHFTQLTATVYVQTKTSAGVPATSLVKGRGRITVGPTTSNGGLVAAF
jgi:Tfp pilus assembly protein PilX